VITTFVNGWANFTDLFISHEGSGYIIDFDIVVPTMSDLSVASDALTVPLRTLLPHVHSLTTLILKYTVMELVLGMRDSGTDEMIEDTIKASARVFKAIVSA